MSLDTIAAVATLRGLTQRFQQGFRTGTPFYPSVCMMVPSTGRDELYGIGGEVPQMSEWLGQRNAHTLRAAKYQLINKQFELTLKVEKNDLADQRVAMYEERFASGGRRGVLHPDLLLAQALINGASVACFDGQYYFSTTHNFGNSGNQSNKITSPAVDPDNVTPAEFKTAFRAAVNKMAGFLDDQGQPLNAPTFAGLEGLQCLTPIALRNPSHDAMESTLLAVTQGSGAAATTNVVIDRPVLNTSTYLADGRSFYVFYTDDYIKPMIFQMRQPLAGPAYKGIDDRETKEILWMTDARYAMGYGAWWNCVKVTFV